jgi:pimeloyl-ACP methyl ester carboxylesterase
VVTDRWALRKPDRVSGLVLTGGPLRSPSEHGSEIDMGFPTNGLDLSRAQRPASRDMGWTADGLGSGRCVRGNAADTAIAAPSPAPPKVFDEMRLGDPCGERAKCAAGGDARRRARGLFGVATSPAAYARRAGSVGSRAAARGVRADMRT